MIQLGEYAKRLEGLKFEAKDLFASVGYPYKDLKENENIHLVFVGQYSAGKSTILTMLTGRSDIKIGEGITTQKVTQYDWNGIEVIDTPGIDTKLRPDHDALSYEAIASADLLVYVITNELFDPNLGARFRTVAVEKDKAGEMILVVNKMNRTVGGNTREQQEIIKGGDGLVNVIKPYSPENLHISFLDSESYVNALKESDPEIAEEYRKRSGYDEFIENLNGFIREKNISSKLTTALYQLDKQIDGALEQVKGEQKDIDVKALEENYRQQLHLLVDSRDDVRQEVASLFMDATSEIKNLGLQAADAICEGCNEKEIEETLSDNVSRAQTIIEEVQDKAVSLLEKKLNDLNLAFVNLEDSEFSKGLKARLESRHEGLPDNVKKVLSYGSSAVKNAGSLVIKNAYNVKSVGGLRFSTFSGSNVHSIVKEAGKAIGYKFKPWQALKITRGVTVAAQVLSIFGVVLNIGLQIAEDVQAEKNRKIMENNRVSIRGQFHEAADGLEKFGRNFIKDVIDGNINPSIYEVKEKINHLQESAQLNNEAYEKLVRLQDSCISLIREVHG